MSVALDIALITEAFLERDGVGRSILSKIQHLEAAGHRVTVWMEHRRHLTMPGQDHRVRFTTLRDVLLEARAGRTDGFLGHDLYLFEYPTYFPLVQTHRLLSGRRVVFDYYGVTPPEYFPDPLAQDFIRRSIEELTLLEDAHAVFAHSEFSRRELAGLARVPADRVHVLPIALDPRYTAAPPPERVAAVRASLGLAGRFVMLYVGRVAGNKGVSTLVEAMPRILRDRPDAQLLVVGEASRHGYELFRGYALSRALDLGVENAVRFLGQVDEDTLHALYGASDVLLSASLHEGFGLPVAEAMACGTPVVVTGVTALPETAGDGGLFFPPHDHGELARQVLRIAAEPGLASELADRARASARRFLPEAVGERLRELIAQAWRRPARACDDRAPLLQAAAQLAVHYEDRLDWPVVGPALSWLRRKLTLHLEKFFLRPMQENQQIFASLVTEEIASLKREIAELARRADQSPGRRRADR